jgi:serine protease Do
MHRGTHGLRLFAILAIMALTGAFIISATHKVAPGGGPALALRLADPREGPAKHTFAPAAAAALPSVVNISSSKVVRTPAEFRRLEQDPGFRQFYREWFGGRLQIPKERREQSLGSGVIVTPNGYILTNSHVVNGATDVRVTLGDKREFKARIIGTDPQTDVAVLSIAASGLPAIVVGDSSKVKLGDCVLAIGNPFGVGQTVTMGIVSATGRGGLGIEDYEDFIQTDAAINPGNSGGALVNDRGELIGINTAIISPAGGNLGVGFAVPANLARTIAQELTTNGKVSRAYMGISPQNITPRMAQALGREDMKGVLVGDVTAGGPAAESGVQKGDIILAVNGQAVDDANQLRFAIAAMAPDSVVQLRILRDSSIREVAVKLRSMPARDADRDTESAHGSGALEGVTVDALTSQIRRALHVSADTSGVVITEIDPSSPASESGLERGDIIEQVNRTPVTTVTEYKAAVAKAGDKPMLLVNRRGATFFVAP